jgi:hypothetical protein
MLAGVLIRSWEGSYQHAAQVSTVSISPKSDDSRGKSYAAPLVAEPWLATFCPGDWVVHGVNHFLAIAQLNGCRLLPPEVEYDSPNP